jgi:hypothetical protein
MYVEDDTGYNLVVVIISIIFSIHIYTSWILISTMEI